MHKAPKSSLQEGLNNWPGIPTEKTVGTVHSPVRCLICSVSVLKVVATKNLNKDPDFLSIIHSFIQQAFIEHSPCCHETQSSRRDRHLRSKCTSVIANCGTSCAELGDEDPWG